MSSSNNVVVTLLFEDDSTRNYTFEGVADEDLLNVRAKINAINANANNEYANFYQTFVSNDGEAFTKISNCKIVAIDEEVVYSG